MSCRRAEQTAISRVGLYVAPGAMQDRSHERGAFCLVETAFAHAPIAGVINWIFSLRIHPFAHAGGGDVVVSVMHGGPLFQRW